MVNCTEEMGEGVTWLAELDFQHTLHRRR